MRLIFGGSVEFDLFELEEIQNFKAYMAKHKKPKLEYTDDSKILRYLQACAWKKDKTYSSLWDIIPYCRSLPPILTPTIQKYLVRPFKSAILTF